MLAFWRVQRVRAWLDVVLGPYVLFCAGLGVQSYATRAKGRDDLAWLVYLTCVAAVIHAFVVVARGIRGTTAIERPAGAHPDIRGFGYRTFVAWRYLMNSPSRVSADVRFWLGLFAILGEGLLLLFICRIGPHPGAPMSDPFVVADRGVALAIYCLLIGGVLRHSKVGWWVYWSANALGLAALVLSLAAKVKATPMTEFGDISEFWDTFSKAAWWTFVGSLAVAFLASFCGSLRGFFTFFTTVPIVGVWIGTSAIIIVLSVMAGFEADLRTKILGSNAHIQITLEDDSKDWTNWKEVEARIDAVPGIVASTPYAISEVIVTGQGGNASTAIVKGIEPKTAVAVTELQKYVGEPKAMEELDPIVPIERTPVVPLPKPTGPVTDPAPPGLEGIGAPEDYSAEPAPTPPAPPAGSGSDALPSGIHLLQHDLAHDLHDTDPDPDHAPPNLVVHASDFDPDQPMSDRSLALPGILIGQELQKQTHMFTGETIRMVSPLADPSNPDATGTPIPYNRDFRVAGIFYTGMYEYDLKYVYVSMSALQTFLNRGNAIDGIEVRVTDPDDTDRYVEQLGTMLGPEYRVQDWKELNRSLFAALKLEKIAMFLVLGIVIIVASFAIVGNLIMVVVEKGKEIALLKTLGASNFGIMQLFAIQGLMIGVIGTALGLGFGLLACALASTSGIGMEADVYYISQLPIHVENSSVMGAAIAGVAISIAATFYPAFAAARIRPATGIRH
ncbi:MAG TPA: FtsX-like permease family protein [Kofleriaceae bacterium]|jgi:lipoprotein-releasing system permease protein